MVFTGEKIWRQNTSGNFLFLATLVGAHSELAHLLPGWIYVRFQYVQ